MTTIAENIAVRFYYKYKIFEFPGAGNLVDVCAHQAIDTVEEFGKKKFVFTDKSTITMGDGQWFVGFYDCFCNAGQGHHPECHSSQPSQGESIVTATSDPTSFVHFLGEKNQIVPMSSSPNKVCTETRSLLREKENASHACVLNPAGEILDAYEKIVNLLGDVKIKKIDPKKLPEKMRLTLGLYPKPHWGENLPLSPPQ